MKEKKRKIFLSGRCIRDFEKEGCEVSCFLCKRPGKIESIYCEDGVVYTTVPEIELSWHIAETEKVCFHYLLCPECFVLLNSFNEGSGSSSRDKKGGISSNLN